MKYHLFLFCVSVIFCFLLTGCIHSSPSSSSSSNISLNISSESPSSSEITSEPLNVTLNIVIQGESGQPKVLATSNLPDGTKLALSLTGGDSYNKETTLTIKDGKGETSALYSADCALVGDYTLTVKFFPATQTQSVKHIIGNNGEYLIDTATGKTGAPALYREITYHSPYQQAQNFSELDPLQTFFTQIPTTVTPNQLESLLSTSELFYNKSHCTINRNTPNEDRYLKYVIASTDDPLCLYDGKVMNGHLTKDYIVVVFDDDSLSLEYILYINYINNAFNCALYYNSGSFGDLYPIWDDYTVEQAGGNYYYYQNRFGDTVPNELVLHFRDDEDVPYYRLRGATVHTRYVMCNNAVDAVKATFPWVLTKNDEIVSTSTQSYGSIYKIR